MRVTIFTYNMHKYHIEICQIPHLDNQIYSDYDRGNQKRDDGFHRIRPQGAGAEEQGASWIQKIRKERF